MSEAADDYDYAFPAQAVAQTPAERREAARLLVVQRHGGVLRDGAVADLPALLRPGDLLVLNEAAVEPARLAARRLGTGGRLSVLVLHAAGRRARVLLGARGRLQPGEEMEVCGDRWRIQRALGEGRFEVQVLAGREVRRLLADAGRMPLPPYIRRDPVQDGRDALDRERYQTSFARPDADAFGAVAAPTAGLHLTPGLLARLQAAGARVATLRLYVGEATFAPLRGPSLDDHVMPSERFELPQDLADAYAATRAAGGRVVAVGTTVVRTLETVVTEDGRALAPGAGETSLFVRPGHRFAAVDALLTNFHRPRSSLLVLVSAFAGANTIRAAYAHAIEAGYRLFSYGDAMLLAPAEQAGPR